MKIMRRDSWYTRYLRRSDQHTMQACQQTIVGITNNRRFIMWTKPAAT